TVEFSFFVSVMLSTTSTAISGNCSLFSFTISIGTSFISSVIVGVTGVDGSEFSCVVTSKSSTLESCLAGAFFFVNNVVNKLGFDFLLDLVKFALLFSFSV